MHDLPPDPPHSADEPATLSAFLDCQRGVMLPKAADLGEEELRKPGTLSNLTLLSILKHLAHVERSWLHTQARRETLRWILARMIEETARHLGHPDIIRGGLDGSTGD